MTVPALDVASELGSAPLSPRPISAKSTMLTLAGEYRLRVVIIKPGRKKQLVFLHGLGASPEVMEHFLSWLADAWDATITAFLLPCHGVSGDVEIFGELVERIAQACDALGLKNVTFMGHSLGALTLLHLADKRPDLVSAGVCLAMPYEQPPKQLGYHVRLGLLAVDVLATTGYALAESSIKGTGIKLARAIFGSVRQGARIKKLVRIIRGVVCVDEILGRQDGRLKYIFGGADWAIRPPTNVEAFGDVDVIAGAPHCFPLVQRYWPEILAVLESTAGPVVVPWSAPANPFTLNHLATA